MRRLPSKESRVQPFSLRSQKRQLPVSEHQRISGDGRPAVFRISWLDKKHPLYQRTAASVEKPRFPKNPQGIKTRLDLDAQLPQNARSHGFEELHYRLLERIAPAGILVNRDNEILHVSESATRYLRVVCGEPSRDILQTIHKDLRLDLRSALYQAIGSGEPAEVRMGRVRLGEHVEQVHVTARPVKEAGAVHEVIQVLIEKVAVVDGDDAPAAGRGRAASMWRSASTMNCEIPKNANRPPSKNLRPQMKN